MAESYTIGEIAAAHGEKVRTVQFWADSGVIKPIEGTGQKGKGTQRKFSEREIRLAGIARRLASMNSPVGEIAEVLSYIREADPIHALDETRRIFREMRESMADVESYSRYNVINAYLKAMSLLLVGGAGTGDIDLIISYYFVGGEVKSRVLFMAPHETAPVDKAAGAALHGFIGFKSLRLNAERDIWIDQRPDKETSESLAEMFVMVARQIKKLASGWKAPKAEV